MQWLVSASNNRVRRKWCSNTSELFVTGHASTTWLFWMAFSLNGPFWDTIFYDSNFILEDVQTSKKGIYRCLVIFLADLSLWAHPHSSMRNMSKEASRYSPFPSYWCVFIRNKPFPLCLILIPNVENEQS